MPMSNKDSWGIITSRSGVVSDNPASPPIAAHVARFEETRLFCPVEPGRHPRPPGRRER
jgi:hypothetical protein